MLIDWFTVAVQVVNFLILIALMKRFLYGPLVRAIDNRQQSIDETLAEAARLQQDAVTQSAFLAGEREALAKSREVFLHQAASEVESWREAALLRIREEIDESGRLWRRQLSDEQSAFFEKLKIRIGEKVVRVADKVLVDLADERLEARLIDVFLVKLGTDHDLAPGRCSEASGLVVVTGRALTEGTREGLRHELTARFGLGKIVLFKVEPGMGFGIRLTLGDKAWEWNLAGYMKELEQDIRQALELSGKSGETDE
jgi:F-type H+-transporting ATPase subunit b